MPKSKIDPIYKKYASKVIKNIMTMDFYEYFMDVVQAGKNKFQFSNRKVEKEVDEAWVVAIENCIKPLEEIINNPRNFIMREEIIVNIALSKKVTPESVRHLAQHGDMIDDWNDKTNEIRPNRLQETFKEDSWNTYENRFVYTLLEMAWEFVDKRYEAIFAAMNEEFGAYLKMEGDAHSYQEALKYNVDLRIQQEEDLLSADEKNQSIFARIARLHRILGAFRSTTFAKEMRKYAKVKPPIVKTNAIKKNPNFKACYKLWEFIMNYKDIGYKIEIYEQNSEIDEDFALDIYNSVFFNYIILKNHLELNEDREIDTSRQFKKKALKPKFIKEIIEEIVKNYDIPDVEIRKVLIEEMTKADLMQEEENERRRLVEEKEREMEERRRLEEEEARERAKEEERERKQAEKERKAEEKRLERERQAEEKRIQKEKEAKEADEKSKASKYAAMLKQMQEDREALLQRRIAAKQNAERLAAEEAERVRKAAEAEAEKKRIAEEKAAEKARLLAEAEAEKKRIAAEKQAERERIAAEKQAEKERIAAEKQAERERIAAEKQRLAAEKQAEKERIAKEKAEAKAKADAEKAKAAKEKAEAKAKADAQKAAEKEKQRIAIEKEKAKAREAAKKAKEKERIAKEKAEAKAKADAEKAENKARIAAEKAEAKLKADKEKAKLKAEAAAAREIEKERIAKEKAEAKAREDAEKQAERERIAAEKQAEKERIAKEKAEAKAKAAAEKLAEKKRLDAEKQKEKDRIAVEKARAKAQEAKAKAKARQDAKRAKEKELLAKQKAKEAGVSSSVKISGYSSMSDYKADKAAAAGADKKNDKVTAERKVKSRIYGQSALSGAETKTTIITSDEKAASAAREIALLKLSAADDYHKNVTYSVDLSSIKAPTFTGRALEGRKEDHGEAKPDDILSPFLREVLVSAEENPITDEDIRKFGEVAKSDKIQAELNDFNPDEVNSHEDESKKIKEDTSELQKDKQNPERTGGLLRNLFRRNK